MKILKLSPVNWFISCDWSLNLLFFRFLTWQMWLSFLIFYQLKLTLNFLLYPLYIFFYVIGRWEKKKKKRNLIYSRMHLISFQVGVSFGHISAQDLIIQGFGLAFWILWFLLASRRDVKCRNIVYTSLLRSHFFKQKW